VGLDLASGRAIHAIWRDRPVVLHPDTQQPLSAICIPRWADILELATRSYDAVPLGYMGIDIVVDIRHGPVILELNARPGLSIQLANRRGLRRMIEAVRAQRVGDCTAAQRVALGLEIEERVRGDT